MNNLISHQNELPDGTITGGEPQPDVFDALKAAGFTSLISLRGVGESAQDRDLFESQGFQFQHLPVSGAADLMGDFVNRFERALNNAQGKTVVFCATGNRVGAAYALHACQARSMTIEEAVALGKNAGLTRLEPFVRQTLTSAQT